MMRSPLRTIEMAICLSGVLATAAATFANVVSGPSTIDGGGRQVSSANYTIDASIGGMGGSGGGGGGTALKSGFAGQLTEVASLSVTVAANPVNEGETNQLGGRAGLDDGTASVIPGDEVHWTAPAYPIASIAPAGLATAAIVPSNAVGTVAGRYLGVNGAAVLTVRDVNPDNFGRYAGDTLPDSWQVRCFGPDNPEGCKTGNPDKDPFDNGSEYVADTDPNDPDSYFRIASASLTPSDRRVTFASSAARAYTLLYRDALTGGTWTNLPPQTGIPGEGGPMSLSDPSGAPRFYRVQVRVPQDGNPAPSSPACSAAASPTPGLETAVLRR